MITFPRTLSLLTVRISLGLAVLSLALMGAWMLSDLCGQSSARAFGGQKPRVEEEEETPKTKTPPKKPPVREEEETPPSKTPPKKKQRTEEEESGPASTPKRKVIRVDEEEDPVTRPGSPRPDVPASGDLRQLAQQAKHPAVLSLFHTLSVPHDHIVFRKTEGVTIGGNSAQNAYDVEPIPVHLGSDPSRYRKAVKLRALENGKRGKPIGGKLENIASVRYYEQIALNEVGKFLNAHYDQKPRDHKEYLSHFDTLMVAEQALSAVLRWHESARQTGARVGKEWDPIEAELRKKLLEDVLLKQMDTLVESRDWNKLTVMARRLTTIYTDRADRERIARPLAELIQSDLKDATANDKKKKQTRDRLVALDRDFPNNEAFRPIIAGLRQQAQQRMDVALKLMKEKGNDKEKDKEKAAEAQRLLKSAEEIWPLLPGLHAAKIDLSAEHPVLRVGVRGQLPQYLSPALACTDAELRAVELLFESLVKMVPEESGIFRYRPSLAERRPKVAPLGRQFQLPRSAVWSNNQPLDATDIRATVQNLKLGVGAGRSRAWGELLDRVEAKGDPHQVTLRLNQGYVDPLALMTFKILPQQQPVESEEFATNPVGSGPFRFAGRRSDEANRECLFFIANPSYGSRAGKHELPRVQEVRFYVCTDPVEELSTGKLDLVLDLTAEEADKLQQKTNTADLQVVTRSAMPNRRVYFLAVNQSKLPSAALRKALAHAINREKLLNDHFRGPFKDKIHRALNGPFPAGSWACNQALAKRGAGGSLDLFDADLARTLSPKQGIPSAPLRLKYPQGDPALEKAMHALCEQVKVTTGLVLEPEACDPHRLREDVERTQSYDVAYYRYDFPDETYWLWPLLGPPPYKNSDSNIFKFSDSKIQPALKEAMAYRDFAEVRKHQWAIHESLLREMPFIPLWQLDPLMAYGRAVTPAALDPVLVFSNIEEWRLRRK